MNIERFPSTAQDNWVILSVYAIEKLNDDDNDNPNLRYLAGGKLTYDDEINDELHDTNKDVINKADDISAEVDDFKEALENPVDGCNVVKIKTEPDDFEALHLQTCQLLSFHFFKITTLNFILKVFPGMFSYFFMNLNKIISNSMFFHMIYIQQHDTNKDVISIANDISAEDEIFKKANEAL